jgi:hypothetical protein
MPVILATLKAEIKEIVVQGQLVQKVFKTSSQQKKAVYEGTRWQED